VNTASDTAHGDGDSTSNLIKGCAIVATLVQCVIFVGLGAFVFIAIGVFQGITASGTADPQAMAAGIATALVPVIVATGVSVFGTLGSVLIVLASNYRARWFYKASVVLAIAHLFAIPFGTIQGLAFLILLIVKRNDFRERTA
jgi:hypothetical protein